MERGRLRVPWRRVLRAGCWTVTAAVALLVLTPAIYDDYCWQECWLDPPHQRSYMFIRHVMDHVLEPAQKPLLPLTEQEVQDTFKLDTQRYAANRFIMQMLQHIENGTYIDVGSGDGEFLSFTSQLEVLFGWQGLLIEPRRSAYLQGRERRRAAGANVCVSPGDYHSKNVLWTPKHEENFSPLLRKISGSKSVLKKYVTPEDFNDGTVSASQCYSLEVLVEAYMRSVGRDNKPVDLLLLDINAGEIDLLDSLEIPRYRVVVVAVRNKIEIEAVKMLAKNIHLKLVVEQSVYFRYAILLHKSIVLSERYSNNITNHSQHSVTVNLQ